MSWEDLNQQKGKVDIETKQARYDLCLIVNKTFSTPNGKKCLEYMKHQSIYKMIPTDSDNAIARAAVNNFVLTLMGQIEHAKLGPPKRGD